MTLSSGIACPPLRRLAKGMRVRFVLQLASIAIAVALSSGPLDAAKAADDNSWQEVSPMNARRWGHGLVTLKDGRAMAISGYNDVGINNDAEIYDPERNEWRLTRTIGGSHPWGSSVPYVAVLRDGRVLVTGGITAVSDYPFFGGVPPDLRAFLYDPFTGAWRQTGSLPVAMGSGIGVNAVLLPSGDVLIAGGYSTDADHNLTGSDVGLIYRVATGRWDFTRDLTRRGHPQTRLPRAMTHNRLVLMSDGRVLCIGGGGVDNNAYVDGSPINAVIFDPATGKWSVALHQMPEIPNEEANRPGLGGGRQWPVVVAFPDGKVLVAGGITLNGVDGFPPPPGPDADLRTSALLFDSKTETWKVVGSLKVNHASADTNLFLDRDTALLLPSAGDALYACGWGNGDTEAFNLPSETFLELAPFPSSDIPGYCDPTILLPAVSPAYSAATLLLGRRALFVGGIIDFSDPSQLPSDRAFIYTPAYR